MKDQKNNSGPAAIRLAGAVKKLRMRLREAASARSTGLSTSHLEIVHRLRSDGPATASSLAESERVSEQAIAQSLAALKRAGIVQSKPDALDKRKNVISMTKAGNNLFESVIASRNAWLMKAIDENIPDKELPALNKAIEILERLATADNLDKNI